jgi:uncharacterized protein YjeT (DUF2065 family)
MLNTLSLFLRRVLLADAIVSGTTGLLLFMGAGWLAGMLQLPDVLLRPVGLFLIAYGALVAYIATRVSPPRQAVWTIIILNGLWALVSIVLLVSGWVVPNALGYAFVIAQALVVAGFAEAQTIGLRQQMKAV